MKGVSHSAQPGTETQPTECKAYNAAVMMLLSRLMSPAVGDANGVTKPSCNQNPVKVATLVEDSRVKLSLTCSAADSDATQQLASVTQTAVTEQQANPTGSSCPAAALSAEQPVFVSGDVSEERSDASDRHDSTVASHRLPLSPTAVPKHMLASHALSLASSSVLDGSDEEEDVAEADYCISHRQEASTSVRHSSDRSLLKQPHGQADAASKCTYSKQALKDPFRSKLAPNGTHGDQDQNEHATHGSHEYVETKHPRTHDGGDNLTAVQSLVNESMANTARTYQLTAAVVHHGSSSNSGHYTVYRLAGPQCASAAPAACQWYSISDEVVQAVHVHEVLASEATLLCYAPRTVGSAG